MSAHVDSITLADAEPCSKISLFQVPSIQLSQDLTPPVTEERRPQNLRDYMHRKYVVVV